MPVASEVGASLAWLSKVQWLTPPAAITFPERDHAQGATKKNTLQNHAAGLSRPSSRMSIREWCAQQDPVSLIGRYEDLNAKGLGFCPFGWHHSDGKDTRRSLWVYRPKGSDVCCWYCHAWQRGGSVFDFLRLYHCLEARELWLRIQEGGHL
jgi:hypothetical protein